MKRADYNGPKKKVSLVLPEHVWETMQALAKEHRRSFNAEVLVALEAWIASDDA